MNSQLAPICGSYSDLMSVGYVLFKTPHCVQCNQFTAMQSPLACLHDENFLKSNAPPHSPSPFRTIQEDKLEIDFGETMLRADMIMTGPSTRERRLALESVITCKGSELYDVNLKMCVETDVLIEDETWDACHNLHEDYHSCSLQATRDARFRLTCANHTVLYCAARMQGFFNPGGNLSAMVIVSVGVCTTFLTLSVAIYCHNNEHIKPLGQLYLCQLCLLILSQLLFVALPQTFTQAQKRACSVIGISFLYIWLAVFCSFLGGAAVTAWYLIRRQYNHPHLSHIVALIFLLVFSLPALVMTALVTSFKQYMRLSFVEVVISQMFRPEHGCFLYTENLSLNVGLLYPLAFTSVASLSLNVAAAIHVMNQEKLSRVFSRSPTMKSMFITQTSCIICTTLSWCTAYLAFSCKSDYLWMVHYIINMILGVLPAVILMKTMCLVRIRQALSRLGSLDIPSVNPNPYFDRRQWQQIHNELAS